MTLGEVPRCCRAGGQCRVAGGSFQCPASLPYGVEEMPMIISSGPGSPKTPSSRLRCVREISLSNETGAHSDVFFFHYKSPSEKKLRG